MQNVIIKESIEKINKYSKILKVEKEDRKECTRGEGEMEIQNEARIFSESRNQFEIVVGWKL